MESKEDLFSFLKWFFRMFIQSFKNFLLLLPQGHQDINKIYSIVWNTDF